MQWPCGIQASLERTKTLILRIKMFKCTCSTDQFVGLSFHMLNQLSRVQLKSCYARHLSLLKKQIPYILGIRSCLRLLTQIHSLPFVFTWLARFNCMFLTERKLVMVNNMTQPHWGKCISSNMQLIWMKAINRKISLSKTSWSPWGL